MTFTDCPGLAGTIDTDASTSNVLVFNGSNRFSTMRTAGTTAKNLTVLIQPGAIIDLTGFTTANVFNTLSSGISFGSNVTVINSAGSTVSLNGGAAGSCSILKNDGTTA